MGIKIDKAEIILSIIITLITVLIIFGCWTVNNAEAKPQNERLQDIYHDDGLTIFVDTKTNVQYILYSRSKTGAAIQVMVDQDGNPLLYKKGE